MSVQALQTGYYSIPHSGGFPASVRPEDISFEEEREPTEKLSEAFARHGILNVIYTPQGAVFRGTEIQAWAVYDMLNSNEKVKEEHSQNLQTTQIKVADFMMTDFRRAHAGEGSGNYNLGTSMQNAPRYEPLLAA